MRLRKPLLVLTIGVILLSACAAPSSPTANAEETTNPTTEEESTITSESITTLASPAGELKVHFIDVGQGDSILIDLEDTEILIDGRGKSPGVFAYLNDYVDGTIDVVVATHLHADHIGGLIAVLDAFQVQQIWHTEDTSESKTYAEFMNGVQS